MTLPTPVTWMEIKDAARLARVPIKTVYRWAQRDDVRRLRLLGRVLVVWEDIVEHMTLGYYRHPSMDGQHPCHECGHVMHEHGWLDTGGAGIAVCPPEMGPFGGQPIVRTVGDLTARHQLTRTRLRVAGREGALKLVKPFYAHPGTLTLIWGDWWEDVAPEEPCEVLP